MISALSFWNHWSKAIEIRKIGVAITVPTSESAHAFSTPAHRNVSVKQTTVAQMRSEPGMSICNNFSFADAGVGAAAFGARNAKITATAATSPHGGLM